MLKRHSQSWNLKCDRKRVENEYMRQGPCGISEAKMPKPEPWFKKHWKIKTHMSELMLKMSLWSRQKLIRDNNLPQKGEIVSRHVGCPTRQPKRRGLAYSTLEFKL